MDRRTFLRATAAAIALPACKKTAPVASIAEADRATLAAVGLDAARSAGATYADVRVSSHRSQTLSTREQRVQDVADRESRGFGVRVIADGAWGFAASSTLTADEVARVARAAVDRARANARLLREPVDLAPVEAERGEWQTLIRRDPFTVPLAEKVELLLGINAEAMRNPGVSFCSSGLAFVREDKLLATTDGTLVEQTLFRCNPWFEVTSVRPDAAFHSRASLSSPQGLGYEYVEDYPWLDDVRQAGEDAVAKHDAPTVEAGPRDLILVPSHLWLTIHESIGHPTELDRAVGLEANYAGTSFLTPDKLGELRIGAEIVSFDAERTTIGALATCKWDDDGVRTTKWPLVEAGVFVDYQTTRDQARWIGRERSYGCSYAQGWADVPFQRMPNVNLRPGSTPLTLEQLIADTEDAILIAGRGSYSIDHQRYNFQFGGQTFHHVKNGAIAGPLRDVAYVANTASFWQSCDAIGSKEAYEVNGTFYDGKGEPGQSNAVSHGCAPARFRQVQVIPTGRA